MHVSIMRHGPAETESRSGRDFDRALSLAGRERTLAAAVELQRSGETFERILSSPLVRARQTAELVASILAPHLVPEIRAELAPSEDAADLVRQLSAAGTASALLVGHSPDVSLLATHLLDEPVKAFDAAMVLGLEVENGRASRRYVIEPR